MYELKKLRADLKYVIEKFDYDAIDIIDPEEFMEVLLGKTKVRDVIFSMIVNIINSRPTDLEDASVGRYGTVYGHKK